MIGKTGLASILAVIILTCCNCGGTVTPESGNNIDMPYRLQVLPTKNYTDTAPQVPYMELSTGQILDPSDTGPVSLTFAFPNIVDDAEVQLTDGSCVKLVQTSNYRWEQSFSQKEIFDNYLQGQSFVFFGYCNTYKDGERTVQYNLHFPVRSNLMPDVDPILINPDMQMTDYVLNLRLDELYIGGSTFTPVWDAVRDRVEQTIGHRDFYALVGQVKAFAGRGGNDNVIAFPMANFFDLANQGTSSELGHRLGLAYSNHPLLHTPGGHWSLGNAATGMMGWSPSTGGGGLYFPYRLEPGDPGTTKLISIPYGTEFNDLELYKLGLISADEIEPVLQFSDKQTAENWIMSSKPAVLPSCGQGCKIMHASSQYVTIDDIIATDGPTPPASKTCFTLGTVVLSRGRLLTPGEMAFFDYMAARGEGIAPVPASEGFWGYESKPFSLATRGLMTLSTRITRKN